MEIEEVLDAIDHLTFKFAKTMPKIPHFYVVKDDSNLEYYKKLFFYIQKNGYYEKFFKKYYKYCNIGGYKYWAMRDDINESLVINRAVL